MDSHHAEASLVTVNGGSSSVRMAVYGWGDPFRLDTRVHIAGIGAGAAEMTVTRRNGSPPHTRLVQAEDHSRAAAALADWLDQAGHSKVAAIGHRVVHGGLRLVDHALITPELVGELRESQGLDLAHLPREIGLIEGFQSRYPTTPQVACFDTAFHRELPLVAQLLPIPRSYIDAGVRRLGFHGLSYTYLLSALRDVAGAEAANGRVILAHLGSGASMAAVHKGKPVDTTMGFTPAAGLMMATRPGDMDPGLLLYLARQEKLDADGMDAFISSRCGLAGISGGTSDVRQLLQQSATDANAAEAMELFCYTARKWIGAYVAVLGGLDTLVFSGGIGEHSAPVRAAICRDLGIFGIEIDPTRNDTSAPVISSEHSSVAVRVIPTDEEAVMARVVYDLVTRSSAKGY